MPGIAAFAADEDTFYPVAVSKDLTFEDLSGYAIEGDNGIFADGERVVMLQGDTMSYTEEENSILAVDVYEGVFYKQLSVDSETVSYACTDGAWTEETEHSYTPRNYTALEGGYTYIPIVYTSDGKSYSYRTSEAGLTIADLAYGTDKSTDLEGYSLLSYYDNVVYAVKDNVLYTFDGETPTQKVFEYYQDKDETDTILVGTSLEKIAATAYDSLKKVTVSASTADNPVYMTEISLSEFNEDTNAQKTYFKPGATFEVTAKDAAEPSEIVAGDELLLLCAVGNAYIVSYDTQAYIMAQTGGTATDIAVDTEAGDVGKAATATEEFNTYYVPFIAVGAQTALKIEMPSDTNGNITYKVKGIITQETYPFLAHDFYVIEDNSGNDPVYAFVPTGCLTLYTYDPESPATTVDPDYDDESNYIKVVVLSILLVIIILAIAGLLIFVGTGHKYKPVDAGTAAGPGNNPEDNDEGQDTPADKK
ncbi:MAG: hypothetical protein LUD51_06270 [Clostridia bacterium]|nr:hypothetical protein [Clostridia bacterium]